MANDKFRVEGKRIRMPVLGWVKMAEALRFEGKIVSGVVGRDGNHWFVSITIEVGDIELFDNGNSPTIGLQASSLR